MNAEDLSQVWKDTVPTGSVVYWALLCLSLRRGHTWQRGDAAERPEEISAHRAHSSWGGSVNTHCKTSLSRVCDILR